MNIDNIVVENKRKYLCIDLSILANKYINSFGKIEEFDYRISENKELHLPIDYELYSKVFGEFIYDLCRSVAAKNIHFLYRQEDILPFLNKEEYIELYNIDFFDDAYSQDYAYVVDNRTWISVAINNDLIKDYRWIYCNNSNLNDKIYEIDSIENIDLNYLVNVDEVFICLSPEYLPIEGNYLFDDIKIKCDRIQNYNHEIYEDFYNTLIFKNKEYDYTNCYCSLLTTDNYLGAILGLKASLDISGCNYPLIVLCSEFLSDKTFETLQKYKIDYRKIKDLRVTSSKSVDKIKDYDKNLSSVINKIYCFKLVEFEKIFFIDADCIVCHNIDFMFEKYKDYDFCGTQCGLRISDTIKKHLDLLDKTFKRFKDTKGFDCYEFYASNLFICTPDNDIFNELEKDYKQGLIELHNDVPWDGYVLTKKFNSFDELITDGPYIYHNDNASMKYWINLDPKDIFRFVLKFNDNVNGGFNLLGWLQKAVNFCSIEWAMEGNRGE